MSFRGILITWFALSSILKDKKEFQPKICDKNSIKYFIENQRLLLLTIVTISLKDLL